jgi:hypothetical protein
MRVSHPAVRRTGHLLVGREGIEPLVVHLACFVTTALQAATRNTTQVEVARVRVELTESRRFELRRFAGLRTVLSSVPDGI